MILFHFFLLYIHYKREAVRPHLSSFFSSFSHKLWHLLQTERRNYALRAQLKIQFRATQKAQVNERRASDSKRRLTSYVFHEVRVPLNTASLYLLSFFASPFLRL